MEIGIVLLCPVFSLYDGKQKTNNALQLITVNVEQFFAYDLFSEKNLSFMPITNIEYNITGIYYDYTNY